MNRKKSALLATPRAGGRRRSAASRTRAAKLSSGIEGFDEAAGGGIPFGRTTLVTGGPGFGKTLLTAQIVAHRCALGEAAIFVAFEERRQQILADIAAFPWSRHFGRVKFIDAVPARAISTNGEFDLLGLLAMLEMTVRKTGARIVVFDGVDVIFHQFESDASVRKEIFRLSDWLEAQGLTALVTAKAGDETAPFAGRFAFLPFLADCVIALGHEIVENVATRSFRILKYRGSAHFPGVAPMIIDSTGVTVRMAAKTEMKHRVFLGRVSSGVPDLDEMLDGGYYRGSCTLISGAPGTAKTTLSGAFAAAACARGERTLLTSFDESSDQIIRNLDSVGIHLEPHRRSGLLRMRSVPVRSQSAHDEVLEIQRLLRLHRARHLVVDPFSALSHAGGPDLASEATVRLLDICKRAGITLVITALLESGGPLAEATASGTSTLADTWIHLSYVVQNGERNRALTIVKSRGTRHSNQVREVLLSRRGVELADVYAAGGSVLMGTLRWEKEREQEAEEARHEQERTEARRAGEERIAALDREIAAQRFRLHELESAQSQDRSSPAKRAAAISQRRLAGFSSRRHGGRSPR